MTLIAVDILAPLESTPLPYLLIVSFFALDRTD